MTTRQAKAKNDPVPPELAKHPLYSTSDLRYFRSKGYSDEEILAFWSRDAAMGKGAVQHKYEATDLRNAIREEMSPQTVAAIIAHLQAAHAKNPEVNREMHWFKDQLIELLGGGEHLGVLMDEAGV